MIETLSAYVEQFGYVAIAIGCFFEGETALLLGGVAAQQGLLTLPGVLMAGLVGTLVGDNAWFYLGRHLGKPFIDRHPHWQARARYVRDLLDQYGSGVIIGLRFFYGLRSVTPFVIGAAHVSRLKFFLLDLIGTLIWLAIVGTVLYFLGAAIDQALTQLRSDRGTLALLAVGALVFLVIGGLFAYRVWLDHRAREH